MRAPDCQARGSLLLHEDGAAFLSVKLGAAEIRALQFLVQIQLDLNAALSFFGVRIRVKTCTILRAGIACRDGASIGKEKVTQAGFPGARFIRPSCGFLSALL